MQDVHEVKDQRTPDYELHMPIYMKQRFLAAVIAILLLVVIIYFLNDEPVIVGVFSFIALSFSSMYIFISTLIKQFTNLERRLEDREKFLAEIPLNGDETILDVGCGNGIFLLEAAKKITTGKGIGIDIWTKRSGDCKSEIFLENAKIEGVDEKVTLENVDARKMPYDDNSFDLIVSGLTMHHIGHGSEKGVALKEMVRVLKPGGTIGIYDIQIAVNMSEKELENNGLETAKKDRMMLFAVKP
jgi:ubiquinone/menaquinone biosynthesis C-methylase UbiE